MFGLSPSKILFTVLVIAVVWYGFKWLGQLQKRNGGKSAKDPDQVNRDAAPATEDLVACSLCGDYVSATRASNCGRADCPHG